jgi:hypothetical protein
MIMPKKKGKRYMKRSGYKDRIAAAVRGVKEMNVVSTGKALTQS